jgi:hypothetical protein
MPSTTQNTVPLVHLKSLTGNIHLGGLGMQCAVGWPDASALRSFPLGADFHQSASRRGVGKKCVDMA